MKSILTVLIAACIIAACSQGDKKKSSSKNEKSSVDAKHLLTKEGIGELKIGMLQKDIEKLLGQALQMKHAKDTGEIWSDTAVAKYGDMDVELYFQRSYREEHKDEMELFGMSTGSTLCKTAEGVGVGDDRNAILEAYPDNPITMGPDSYMVNDTTWALSKTDYFINVSDDKWDKQINFRLVNKKVTKMEASLNMGE
ncbi:MAG: hypothetical protein JNM88_02750 [Chitinophagaceae bacterium]|nr:hypothetical protein [Chitinophagaceae bacterium]